MIQDASKETAEQGEKTKRTKDMATQLQRPTAKIYAFPTGGRAPSRFREVPRTAQSGIVRLPVRECALGVQQASSWYHEEAVEEEN
jgi:hypothetical protein